MNCIETFLSHTSALNQLKHQEDIAPCSLFSVSQGVLPHFLHRLSRETGRPVLFVTATDYQARELAEAHIYSSKIYLPDPEPELRLVEERGRELSSKRVEALSQMRREKTPVVYLSLDALLYKMCPPDRFFANWLTLGPDSVIEPSELLEKLKMLGYERTELVEAPGQMSGRGEILEMFPPDSPHPYRITFFDDTIEAIRAFDTDTQRSFGGQVEKLVVCPAREMRLTPEETRQLADYLRHPAAKELEAAGERLAFELEEVGAFANLEAMSGLFAGWGTVKEYLRHPWIVWQDFPRLESLYDRREKERETLFAGILEEGSAFGCELDAREKLDAFFEAAAPLSLNLAGLVGDKRFPRELDLGTRVAAGFGGKMDHLASALQTRIKGGWQAYLFAGAGARQLSRTLEEEGVLAPLLEAKPLGGPGAATIHARLKEGFEIVEAKALFLSEKEIFGAVQRTKKKKAKKKQPGLEAADLKEGDIVVHEIHGKGRFLGIRNMEVGGVKGDYLELEYRDGDRLYIQTSQIQRVQKYIGPGDEDARLSKLGGKEWENAKARAKNSIKQLTEDLLAIYADRANRQGYAFSRDTVWQRQFEENFPYQETEGQLESTRQIKRDMESHKVMDRLLLGDTGYGKTEVAMRACFKAVMDSRQVAVLAPTTLLVRQHLATFRERFAGFPVKIAMLSRYTKDSKAVLEGLKEGSIDIVIGTHRLLSKNVQFKNLGLLVIDEEQRFGVSHKERIKDMKRDVDVLTLTATPIPRTLEMAMTGIRDMSTIDTPPGERKEVRAFVAEFSWGLVREAILKEMNRGGQTYFVCRRIGQMDALLSELKKAVPEARIVRAHGQMSEKEFDEAITAFYERQYDVLLSTTIIESGVDIPSVNTIIVYEADKFGLSQLYQLKGRVGRSSLAAYAYFTHLPGAHLSETAEKRLLAIREFTRLGSGFKIALRDLEIRGAGNILGAEQSGHMSQIGYNLYCKLVKEAVDEATTGKPPQPETDTTVELGASAFIPAAYIPDQSQKLDAYQRIAGVKNLEEAKELRQELLERYGKLPREVENLLIASVIREAAERASIAAVLRNKDGILLKFSENAALNPKKLMAMLALYKDVAVFRASTPPAILFRPKKGHAYTEMLQLLGQISRCT